MTLEEAIAEVRLHYNNNYSFVLCTGGQSVETLLKAVASGDLIPSAGLFSSAKTYTEAEVKLVVALAYQRAAEYSDKRQDHDIAAGILALADSDALAEVQALRADLNEMAAEVHGHIKMWGDALRRAEAAEAEFAMARTDADQTRIALRAAEAEVVWLREALTRIEGKDSWIDASIRSDGPERKVMRGEFGEIASAALQLKKSSTEQKVEDQ